MTISRMEARSLRTALEIQHSEAYEAAMLTIRRKASAQMTDDVYRIVRDAVATYSRTVRNSIVVEIDRTYGGPLDRPLRARRG